MPQITAVGTEQTSRTTQPPVERADEAQEEWTDNPIIAWQRWQSVVPTIEDQALERVNESVTLQFRLDNRGDEQVLYRAIDPCFVAGTYYKHPSCDPYEIEGNDRHIAIWLTPAYHWCTSPSTNKVGPDEERRITVSVVVPSDMPNPVTVGVALVGPMVEMNGWLGETRKLRWIEKSGAESP